MYIYFINIIISIYMGYSLVGQTVRNPPAMQETWAQSLDWEDPLGEGNGHPLQYSCLENSTDRGDWWATVHGGCKESDTTEWLTLSVSLSLSPYVSIYIGREIYRYIHLYRYIFLPLPLSCFRMNTADDKEG